MGHPGSCLLMLCKKQKQIPRSAYPTRRAGPQAASLGMTVL